MNVVLSRTLLVLLPLLASCATTRTVTLGSTRAPVEPATVPLRMVAGVPFVPVRVAGSPRLHWFLLDTGATTCVVTPELAGPSARRLRVHDLQLPGMGDEAVLLPSVALADADGHATFEGVFAMLNPLTRLSESVGFDVDGVLGFALFRDTTLTIDFQRALLHLAPEPLTMGAGVVPMRLERGRLPYVELRLGPRSMWALMDTGNSGRFDVPGDVAWASPPTVVGETSSIDGAPLDRRGRLREDVLLAGVRFERPVASLGDAPVVGSGTLSAFTVSFDQRSRLARLVPSGGASGSLEPQRSFGFSLAFRNGRWVISSVLEGSVAAREGLRPGERVVRLQGLPASADVLQVLEHVADELVLELEQRSAAVRLPRRALVPE